MIFKIKGLFEIDQNYTDQLAIIQRLKPPVNEVFVWNSVEIGPPRKSPKKVMGGQEQEAIPSYKRFWRAQAMS